MSNDLVKVLYIAGPTRSGSTILSNILGEIDGFFNAGQIFELWDKGLAENGLCGCGQQVTTCEIWSTVLKKAFTNKKRIDVEQMIRQRDSISHSRFVPQLILIPGAKSKVSNQLHNYFNNLSKLYEAIQETTNSRIIVDASKNAGYAYTLKMIPKIDLYIVHLIRDPRATAYSWKTKKDGLGQMSPLKNSLRWNLRNILTEVSWKKRPQKYMRIYYEEFVSNPRQSVEKILSFLHEKKPTESPFINENEVKIGIHHTIYGNPIRFKSGVTKLQMDNRWKNMKKSDNLVVTALTWPLLIRHRYPILT